ncbi:MAG TPA: flagellar hook-basal body complex protein, partial [Acidobacteria bacterium]|nr:flagellar hook-basal body complex protein [Acidobacteriota bacterium]
MTSSLFTALSGLKSHQGWIDVIGNNLANSNTTGFKTSRVSFADAFSQTMRFANGPGDTQGGRNPVQVGLGVTLANIGRSISQGALQATGRSFDLALQGRGWFTLSDGTQNLYSRVGTFGLDSARNLVDQRTGSFVLGTDQNRLNIDVDELFAPQATTEMVFAGNLPAVVDGPLAEVLTGVNGMTDGTAAQVTNNIVQGAYTVAPGSTWSMEVVVSNGAPQQISITDAGGGSIAATTIAAELDALQGVSAAVVGGAIQVTTDRTGEEATIRVSSGSPNDLAELVGMPLATVTGSESAITGTSLLNNLPGNVTPYVAGDQIEITGVDTDGTPINSTFTFGTGIGQDGVLVDDLVSFMDGLYTDAQVSMNVNGQIVVEAQTAGETDLLIGISDVNDPANTEWYKYAVSVTTAGTEADTVVTSTEIFDLAGIAHTVTLKFERQADRSWNIEASIPESEGTVILGGAGTEVTNIEFGADGAPIGLGAVGGTLSILFNGQPAPQSVNLDLGSDGEFDGLTQFGSQSNAFVQSQDGFGDGSLANLSVGVDGSINGFYTNGQSRELGAIGIATFVND